MRQLLSFIPFLFIHISIPIIHEIIVKSTGDGWVQIEKISRVYTLWVHARRNSRDIIIPRIVRRIWEIRWAVCEHDDKCFPNFFHKTLFLSRIYVDSGYWVIWIDNSVARKSRVLKNKTSLPIALPQLRNSYRDSPSLQSDKTTLLYTFTYRTAENDEFYAVYIIRFEYPAPMYFSLFYGFSRLQVHIHIHTGECEFSSELNRCILL